MTTQIADLDGSWRVRRDPVATQVAAKEGMDRSEEGRNEHQALLDSAIKAVALRLMEFTADDVWEELGDVPAHKGLASAMGPALTRAARNGWIENNGKFQRCERPVSHGKPISVWSSLIGEVSVQEAAVNPYLRFETTTVPDRKTPIIQVWSTRNGILLGQIKWFGRWRQYSFFPEPGTAWNPDCLETIGEYISSLMAAREVGVG